MQGLIDVFGEDAKNALATIEFKTFHKEIKTVDLEATKVIANYSINDLWHILFSFDKNQRKKKL